MKFLPLSASAMDDPLLLAGAFDQDTPHGRGCCCEEVAAVVPLLCIAVTDQAQICFVDQRRRLQGLPGLLLSQPLGGEFAQFVVDERE